MTIAGVDYAWDRPGGKALAAAGKHFACRYASHDAKKDISHAEAVDLAAHGIWTVLVFESTPGRALAGHNAGVADANTALKVATAAGMPKDRPIYFAVDFDANSNQQGAINAYLDGAASVLGRPLVGVYGGYDVVRRTLDAGKAHWAWQTRAWSHGRWDTRAVMRQTASATIGGASCDLNTADVVDYGQWQPGKTPDPRPPVPTVDLSNLVRAVQDYPHHPAVDSVKVVQQALAAEHLYTGAVDGVAGPRTKASYGAWQHRCGYTGKDADGKPGPKSLAKLAKAHGFKVIA